MRTVPERLRDAAALFEERNAAYGGNYLGFGQTMDALFPNGLEEGQGGLSVYEMNRLVHVCHIMTKLTRYCRNLRSGGHADSLEDMSVYCQMLREVDDLEAHYKESLHESMLAVMEPPAPIEDPPEAAGTCEWNTRAGPNSDASHHETVWSPRTSIPPRY